MEHRSEDSTESRICGRPENRERASAARLSMPNGKPDAERTRHNRAGSRHNNHGKGSVIVREVPNGEHSHEHE
jgi:hypothetical protein